MRPEAQPSPGRASKREGLPASGAFHARDPPAFDFEPACTTPLQPIELVLGSLDLCLSGYSGLGCFIKSSLREPACNVQAAPFGSSLWPIPPPRWRWSGQARSAKSRRRRRYFCCRARLLQVIVCSLNWETLGHPPVAPDNCRLGAPISPSQDRVINHLEALVDRYLSCKPFAAEALGRCGPKFHALLRVAKELPRVEDVDPYLGELVCALKQGFDYGPSARESSFQASAETTATGSVSRDVPEASRRMNTVPEEPPNPACLGFSTPLGSLGALKVVSSRIKWKHSPSFDPRPFLENEVLLAAYENPEILRRPSGAWPTVRPALVHCDRTELLALARALDAHGALKIFGSAELADLDPSEEVGLFGVPKDSEWDRLIINPVVVNSRMYSLSEASKRLSPGWLLGSLTLRSDQALRFHAADLSDFYHSFKVSHARALRNRLRARFSSVELRDLSAYSPDLEEPLGIGLNTLAMGDSLAVEVAQASHEGLLRQKCGSMLEGEVLRYRSPVPRTDHIEALAIDDHISFQKLSWEALRSQAPARDTQVFELASAAYDDVFLHRNAKKDKIACTSGVVLGAEVDGVLGVVSAPRERVLCLGFISAVVASRGSVSGEVLDTLLGCWVHVLLFRRPIFCIVDALFHEGKGLPRQKVFELSRQARNELYLLSFLGGLAQASLRSSYRPELFCLDASPWAGAVCSSRVGSFAASEFWRRSEQRGYYTKLAGPASAVLLEHGLDHEGANLFGQEGSQGAQPSAPPKPFPRFRGLSEGFLYDVFELSEVPSSWTTAHSRLGLRVFAELKVGDRLVRFSDIRDATIARELISLAARRVVKEWHVRVPRTFCKDFQVPCGSFEGCSLEVQTLEHLPKKEFSVARRIGAILNVVVRSGQFVSVEHRACSALFSLECFKTLARAGCVLSPFCQCAFGAPFEGATTVLHNKPWFLALACSCACAGSVCHFSPEADLLTAASREDFLARCQPSALAVYGFEPEVGDSLEAVADLYPLPFVRQLAAGSVSARRGGPSSLPTAALQQTADRLGLGLVFDPVFDPSLETYPPRDWHEDPEWISELCRSLRFREKFRYKFRIPGHINVNEARVLKSWLKSLAKEVSDCRVAALLDSRVTIGAAAKGRSSSFAISRVLQGCLGYVLGSGLYPGLLHCYSGDNRADDPSRDKPVQAPTLAEPLWLTSLQSGSTWRFDAVADSCRLKKLPARWLRFLLLLAGDIERNPGPVPCRPRVPRGSLDPEAGFARSTAHKMRKALESFESWLLDRVGLSLDSVLQDNRAAEMALRGFGLYLYSEGFPRYLLVYALTAVQNRCPSLRNHLAGAWQVDRKWQLAEPGECRSVLPAAAVRAALCLATLWGWYDWTGVVLLGFLAMLHPAEMLALTRRDLVFPADSFHHVSALFVYLKNPKTARFARRQHGKIDDFSAISVIHRIFGHLGPDDKLFPASMHTFRRLWDLVTERLGIPCRAALRGATPGVLRGSGATHFYQQSENLQLLAWRGRWARSKTLEYYLQEVAAQMLLSELPPESRSRILAFDRSCDAVLSALPPSVVRTGSTGGAAQY